VSRRLKLLIDECLHTSLVGVANGRQYEAYHVAHLGMSGLKDHQLMPIIREKDLTFVTNNAVDFKRLFRDEMLHAGLVIIVPNVVPAVQRALFAAVLEYVGDRDLTNRAVEISLDGQTTLVQEYEIPPQSAGDRPPR
jgi:predicted nuclease of predicted toxin-antitoxin system